MTQTFWKGRADMGHLRGWRDKRGELFVANPVHRRKAHGSKKTQVTRCPWEAARGDEGVSVDARDGAVRVEEIPTVSGDEEVFHPHAAKVPDGGVDTVRPRLREDALPGPSRIE